MYTEQEERSIELDGVEIKIDMKTNFSTIWDGDCSAFDALAQNCIAVWSNQIEYVIEFDIASLCESDNELETANNTIIVITDIWEA